MSYRRFFVIRLAQALIALWLVATLVFVMFFVLLPKPGRNLAGGNQATPAEIERIGDELHLDAPLHERYAAYLWRVFGRQSAGKSNAFTDPGAEAQLQDTGAIARHAIPPTLSLVIFTLVVSLGVGGLLGFVLARRSWRRLLYGLPIYVAIGLLPAWVGIELSYYFGVKWHIVLPAGYCSFFASAGEGCGGPVDWITQLILPVVTLSLALAAVYTRMVRAELLRGTGRRALVLFFARVAAFDFGALIGLAVFVETTFGVPGLGNLTVLSYHAQALVLMQSAVLYAALLGIAASFLVDAVVAALDPALRVQWTFVARPKRAT